MLREHGNSWLTMEDELAEREREHEHESPSQEQVIVWLPQSRLCLFSNLNSTHWMLRIPEYSPEHTSTSSDSPV